MIPSTTIQELFSLLSSKIVYSLSLFLFECNDAYTRASVENRIGSDIRAIQVLDHRFIHEYKVICDETNNRPNSTTLNVGVCINLYYSVEYFEYFTLNARGGVRETLERIANQLVGVCSQTMKSSRMNHDNY